MNNFIVSAKTPLMFGKGTSLQAAKEFKKLGCSKVLVVLDPTVRDLKLHEAVYASMGEEGIDIVTYNNVISDPTDTLVDEGGELYKANNCDGVLGLGGGAAMDMAKGIAALATNEGPISKYVGRKPMNKGCPLIQMATTIGTGSELSIAAVYAIGGKKLGLLSPALMADLSIMDPSFVIGLPQSVIACSGLDIMLHTVETITSAYRNPSSDVLARGALGYAVQNLLPAMYAKGEEKEEAMSYLAFASSCAAMAFNDAMVHVGHHIAHTLGAFFHTPHGECCSLTIPAFCKYFAGKMPKEMKLVAETLKLDPNSATLGEDMSNFFKDISQKAGLHTAKELNYSYEKMLEMLDYVHGRVVQPGSSTPFDVTKEDITVILKDIYENT